MDKLEHVVEVSPSYYLIRPEPSQNYGVGNCQITFLVKGDKGAVQLMLGTEWGIEPTRKHLNKFGFSQYDDPRQPRAWDLGFHSKTPMYEGHSKMSGACAHTGGDCYYDGSSLNGEAWIEPFLAGGTNWLWPKLEEYYRYVFDGGEYPDLTVVYRPHPSDSKEKANG